MRIAVCAPQVPFEHGGAELFTETLVSELQKRDHEATLVTIPFKWYPGTRVLTQAFLWRLLDLEESNGRKIDLVVGTKFPSYAVRHPNKVIWCVHQFRQAYDFDRTDLGQFSESPEDRATIEAIRRLDEVAFGEAKAVFATSQNVAGRIKDSIGVDAQVMPHPAQTLAYRFDGIGNFVLSVGRLDRTKRVDLLLEAAKVGSFRVVVAGDGPERARHAGILAHQDGIVRPCDRIAVDMPRQHAMRGIEPRVPRVLAALVPRGRAAEREHFLRRDRLEQVAGHAHRVQCLCQRAADADDHATEVHAHELDGMSGGHGLLAE